jgi:hypothetical protein
MRIIVSGFPELLDGSLDLRKALAPHAGRHVLRDLYPQAPGVTRFDDGSALFDYFGKVVDASASYPGILQLTRDVQTRKTVVVRAPR